MSSPFSDKHGQKLSWGEAIKKIINRLRNYLLDFQLMVLHCLAKVPLHSFRRLVFTLSGIKMGKKTTIHTGARFYQPKNITIGTGTIIGDHATLDGRAPLTIGDHVDIASEVMIFNSQHDIHHPLFEPIEKPVVLEDYVFIGPRAIVLPGVTIKKGAVVGAGAVVTKDVEEKQIVGGVPARQIGERQVEELNYRLGRFRLFQ